MEDQAANLTAVHLLGYVIDHGRSGSGWNNNDNTFCPWWCSSSVDTYISLLWCKKFNTIYITERLYYYTAYIYIEIVCNWTLNVREEFMKMHTIKRHFILWLRKFQLWYFAHFCVYCSVMVKINSCTFLLFLNIFKSVPALFLNMYGSFFVGCFCLSVWRRPYSFLDQLLSFPPHPYWKNKNVCVKKKRKKECVHKTWPLQCLSLTFFLFFLCRHWDLQRYVYLFLHKTLYQSKNWMPIVHFLV